ncbi:hypothetical protein BKA69DRAFT_1127472 [Paraphysoderma sedebokerense]|nr:hypothetical protein BKA69DRAFT_1127472 [Paraphysoderma sedebokerense]
MYQLRFPLLSGIAIALLALILSPVIYARPFRSIGSYYYPESGAWTGRLILPPKNERLRNGAVYMEVYSTPKDVQLPAETTRVIVSYDLNDEFANTLYDRTRVNVNLDTNRKSIEKAIAKGDRPLVRLDQWDRVSPLESLAGSRTWKTVIADEPTIDNVEVILPKVLRFDQAANTVFITEEPVQIVGRQVALIQVEQVVHPEKQEYAVKFWDSEVQEFVQTKMLPTIIFKTWEPLDQVVADNVLKRYRFKPDDLGNTGLNKWGWYIYGEMGPSSGKFEVRAIEPRRLTMIEKDVVDVTPRRLTMIEKDVVDVTHTDVKFGEELIRDRFWRNTGYKNGHHMIWKLIGKNGGDEWNIGDRGLIVANLGGVGGQKSELKIPLTNKEFNTGHMSYGISEIILDPITGQKRFDLEYYQVYATNVENIISGRQKSHVFLGSVERGWIFNRAIGDIVIRHPVLDYTFQFDDNVNFNFLETLKEEIQIMMARYRTGDGTGISKVSLYTSCVQDSNLAFFNAIQRFHYTIHRNKRIQSFIKTETTSTDSIMYTALSDILYDYESDIVSWASRRDDWRKDWILHQDMRNMDVQKGNKWHVGPVKTIRRLYKSLRILPPRWVADDVEVLFWKRGASLWMIQSNHIPKSPNAPLNPGFQKTDPID